MKKKLTPEEVLEQHKKAINELSNKKEEPTIGEQFACTRLRIDSIWLPDEMQDLKAMVKFQYKLPRIAKILCRSEHSVLTRIMRNGLGKDARLYMEEARQYYIRSQLFAKYNKQRNLK